MTKVAIRTATAEKNILLHEKYSLADVEELIRQAGDSGRRLLILDGDRDGKVVLSIGGTEPFTIREQRPSRVL